MNTEPTEDPLLLARKSNKFAILSSILMPLIVLVMVFSGKAERAHALTIDEKDVEARVDSENQTIASIIEGLELKLNIKELEELREQEVTMLWEPVRKVNLQVNGEETTFWTTAKTVKELLADVDVEVKKHDKVNYELETEIVDHINIVIDRAFSVVLKDGTKKEKKLQTISTTVENLLDTQKVTLGEFDRVEPALDTIVEKNDEVQIYRVEKVTDVVKEVVDYAIVTKKDASLEKGQEKIVQEGKEGLIEKTFEITKENGQEIARKQISEEKVKDAQDKIVSVGTKVIVKQASRGQGQSEAPSSGKEMTVEATAYTAYCNGCSGITATGINLRSNPGLKVIAVDPSIIPLGSKVWVDGYGTAIAGDTGGAIKGNRIDLFMDTKEQAYRFGRKQIKIRVLN